MAALPGRRRRARPRAPGRRLLAAGEVRGRAHGLRPARARRGGRPHLLRPGRPDLGDRALRARARDQVRDLRDPPHPRRDHRRAARLDWVPRSVRARAREIERANVKLEHKLQRAPDRRGDGGRARDRGGGVPGVADPDLQLDDRRARRAVDGVGLQRRPGLAARHAPGPRRARPGEGDGRHRPQGPRGRRDRAPARAREARDRPLLLREPDPARDRRGPRRHRVAHLPAAHQGRSAPALAHAEDEFSP